MKQKPEIMSPAGYWPQLRAAVEAGADAVYLGLDQFSARAKVGFTQEELPEAMSWLRERGVKGYVTFNTLVYDEELDRAAQMLADLADIGPDALIVQDLGIARLAREVAPELEIHGSTQMSIANAEGVRLAQRFGVRRVVLARELSLHEVRPLVEIGISALKIEGRYKEADYVALTTRAYRAAVDAAWDGGLLQIEARDELDLEQVYSRGLGPHFLQGTNHQTVVRGRAPRHRGVRVGSVRAVRDESVLVEPEPAAAAAPLKAGDGVVFDAADWRDPALPEEGGHVYHVLPVGEGTVEVSFANGAIDFTRIRPGDWLWRTRDPQLEKRVRPYVQAKTPLCKQALVVRAIARVGAPLRAEWTLADDASISVEVCSSQPLSVAQNRALDVDYLRAQWNRLGHTPYVLDVLELDTDEDVFMPVSALGALRQEAVEALRALQKRPKRQPANDPKVALGALRSAPETPPHSARPQLHLLVRTPEQLEAALSLRPASVTLDYLDLYDLRPAVDAVRAQNVSLRVASPRIVKQGEEVDIVGMQPQIEKTVVTGVEMFRKLLDQGQAGDNIGALLRGVKREDIQRGQVLAKPGSITPHTKFKAQVYVLSKEEGGRHTPFVNGYRPQFYFRTTDVTGVIQLLDGAEMIMPGDNAVLEVELIVPIAMEDGLRFAIREGGRTVGAGVVEQILE